MATRIPISKMLYYVIVKCHVHFLFLQRILQPYVDKVFESIFTIPQGRQLPKAIKSLFDFLDLQASDLGIQDSEILHTWKTNRYVLKSIMTVQCNKVNIIILCYVIGVEKRGNFAHE